MNFQSPMYFILLVLQCFVSVCSASGFGSAIRSMIYTGYENIRCTFSDCCDKKWIKDDIGGLERNLKEKLHGQHLVQRTVIGHIRGHLNTDNPDKALVLSFHGLAGIGKNFVSKIIADSIYKDGLKSPYVHLMLGSRHFPHEHNLALYKEQLKSWIEGNVTKCERSMFIIDEIDKIPAGLLDVIKPYADYHTILGGVNYRKSIFIFLSNTGGAAVGKLLYNHLKSGNVREKLPLRDVEETAMLHAVNADNKDGFWHSQLIASHLITAYIPFLPLEKVHVRECIKDALIEKRHCPNRNKIPATLVDAIMMELKFDEKTDERFASIGCKRVSDKVDFVMVDETCEDDKKRKHSEL